MITSEHNVGSGWHDVREKLLQRWSQLSHQDLDRLRGNSEQLFRYLQERTGEARDVLEQYVGRLMAASGTSLEEVSERARQYAQEAAQSAEAAFQQAGDQLRASWIETERLVRRRPVESMACTLAAGLFCGLVLGLAMRSK